MLFMILALNSFLYFSRYGCGFTIWIGWIPVIVMFVFGVKVVKGERKSIKWCFGFSVFYLIIGVISFAFLFLITFLYGENSQYHFDYSPRILLPVEPAPKEYLQTWYNHSCHRCNIWLHKFVCPLYLLFIFPGRPGGLGVRSIHYSFDLLDYIGMSACNSLGYSNLKMLKNILLTRENLGISSFLTLQKSYFHFSGIYSAAQPCTACWRIVLLDKYRSTCPSVYPAFNGISCKSSLFRKSISFPSNKK